MGFLIRQINWYLNKIIYKVIFIIIWLYIIFFLKNLIFWNFFLYSNELYYTFNILGVSLIFSGILLGLFILFLIDTKINWYKNFVFFFLIGFFLIIYYFINETSYIMFFLYYELFLFPSFFIVYFLSPNRRSVITSIYFLMWTQLGSFFVFLLVIYIYVNTQSIYLYTWKNMNYLYINILLFLGFGIKVPIWPFYYWLTKTHVEATSFFSIYLSGFLVKTAIYGFNFFYILYINYIYYNVIYIIILFGILDSSIKMWYQIDLKKLIAFSTVQEMNIILLLLLFNNLKTQYIVALFIITHALLSSLFFFIVDVIYKRFNTRSLPKLSGLIHILPNTTICIFISFLLFSSLPYTLKFFVEIYTYNFFIWYNFTSFLFIIFVCNIISICSMGKIFFNILFGHPIYTKFIKIDLTKKELYLFIYLFLNLFIFIWLTILIF